MIIMTVWTNAVTKMQVLASGFITVVNIFIWYYVLDTIVSNLGTVSLVFMYALGCAVGTMIGTYYYGQKEKKAKVKRKANKKSQLADSEAFQTEVEVI